MCVVPIIAIVRPNLTKSKMSCLKLVNVSDLCPGQDIREITSIDASSHEYERVDDLRWGASFIGSP